ncbi:MAG: S26 family signal peptidase, partial [Candidatus Methanomethylophilaceae archaeon]|nr:S26 family signal peptidase [Candidatus Methanomethylophilaceae archaeon]
MEKETRNTLIVISVVLVLLIGGYAGIKAYSGVSPPFTVINSGSMMHSSDSQIGIIDTGDMIVVKDPDTVTIHTYVDG